MKHLILAIFLNTICGAPAWADWDPELEAREQAEHAAAQRAEQEKQREMQKIHSEAEAKAHKSIMDSKRQTVGAAANGKSDAEVNRLYDAKIKQTSEDANRMAQEARSALSQGQGAAALKRVTGKTLQELENMSDAEADALAREMEKKYGQ